MALSSLKYNTIHTISSLISRLPLGLLYSISDMLYVLVYRIIGYRRAIVWKNLTASFPEKSTDERRTIEKKFYHWFCDYFVETLKMMTASDEFMLTMIEFRGMEKLEEVLRSGQGAAGFLGHYGNWEFLSCTKLGVPGFQEWDLGLIYHQLRNADFDKLLIDIRGSHHGTMINKKDILRALVMLRAEKRNSLFGYILDQSPKWTSTHLWLPFLNQDTPVFTGAERIARKMKDAVFYVDMYRPRRGRYIFDFKLVTLAPQEMEEYELTRQTFKMLEESIRRQPECYLWTHNRWKHTHEEYDCKVERGEIKASLHY